MEEHFSPSLKYITLILSCPSCNAPSFLLCFGNRQSLNETTFLISLGVSNWLTYYITNLILCQNMDSYF